MYARGQFKDVLFYLEDVSPGATLTTSPSS